MKIYLANEDVRKAVLLGDLYAITNEGEFTIYTSEELLSHLTNRGVPEHKRVMGIIERFGVTDVIDIWAPGDYSIKAHSTEFRIFCEDDIPDNYVIVSEGDL